MTFDNIESCAVIAGAITTAVFSFLIWRANIQSAKAAKGAADAANESAQVSKMIFESQEELKKNVRDQLKRDILTQFQKIEKQVRTLKDSGITSEVMNKLPVSINITNHELGTYFETSERKVIHQAMSKYEEYIKRYFVEGIPKFIENEELTKDTQDLHDKVFNVILLFIETHVATVEVNISDH
ncbi:hypothetical protein [Sporosarcina sp. P33]|uniref:hypothetical protein n=1 Tax=Sporosarcina sp. P33 TaxID=1930764 RepID=UPI0009BF8F8B|nr:hypothetical protein [Sporosarcina sp. P33]ARD49050.1 hypothetical protein SporoP33_12925 [Sporosarcina sp. P33]